MAQGPRLRYATVISTVARIGKVAAFALTTPVVLSISTIRHEKMMMTYCLENRSISPVW